MDSKEASASEPHDAQPSQHHHQGEEAETGAGGGSDLAPPKKIVFDTEDGGRDADSIATTAVEEDRTRTSKAEAPSPRGSTQSESLRPRTSHSDTPPPQSPQPEIPRPEDSQPEIPRPEDSQPESPPEATRSKGRTALIMSALCMAVFLAALDTTIITTALPSISEHFHSAAGYTWIGSAYLLGAAASTPLWGKFSDIFGRKPILLIANVVFLVGSVLAGAAVNISMLIAARAIQGCGGGGLILLVNICIGDLFSMRSRGAYYGMVGGVWALASAVGPLLGGVFAQKVSWRWCFYINLPLDGAAFFIILFFLNNLHHPRTPIATGLKAIDWVGCLTIVGGTLMLLLGLQFGGETFPWKSATVICLIVFGIVTIGLFVINEWRLARYPIIPLHIFSKRSNIACLLVCFCHGYVFIGGSYYLPLYFQACLGATPLLSGVYTLASALSLSFASMATGISIKKTGQYLPPIWGGLAIMTLGYGLFIDLDARSSWAKIILYQIVAGIGVGPLFQAPLIALQSQIPAKDIAAGTATFQFTRNLATAVSVVIGGVVFQNTVSSQSARLARILGPGLARQLSGFAAVANVGLIDSLPSDQKSQVRDIFADSLRDLWIMYVCFAALGLLASFLITKQALKREHETTRTGLEEEEMKRQERIEKRRSRKASSRILTADGFLKDLEKVGENDSAVEVREKEGGGGVLDSKAEITSETK
ncbi:hypothetical protein FKW77_009249 [Venturia effusa]|uniref:Efflux pump dotC n=1 Tax=Venturia effusa TaxID=50376 RepID=A0A517KX78_9PEZI|nr:hypothetical protein FKW77_009249 [Venturia effusa]